MSDNKHAGGKRKRNDPDGPGECTKTDSERLLNMTRAEEAERLASIKVRVGRLMKVAKSRNFSGVTQEIAQLRDEHEEVQEEKHSTHQDNSQQLRQERSRLGEEIHTDVEALEEDQREHHIYELIKLPRGRQAQREEAEHMEALKQETRASMQAAAAIEVEQPALLEKLALEQAREKLNVAELQKEKAKLKAAIKWGSEMKERAENALKEFALFDERSKHDINDLDAQLRKYGTELDVLETSFRAEFDNEVKGEVATKRASYTEEIDQGLAKLEENYRCQAKTNDVKLRSLQDKSSDLKLSLDTKTKVLATMNEDYAALQKDVRTAAKEVADLNADIHKTNDTYASASSESKRNLAAKREEKHLLDCNYDDLMDVRVRLDQEINRYKSLLDNEEDRLNYTSPHKQ